MKKKLNLTDLKVKSFVTEMNTEQVKGGAFPETHYSCLKFITCDLVKCFVTTQSPNCIETA